MKEIEIALAIGVSMFIFSMMATMVVEIIIKIFRLRPKGLKMMLGAFYKEVVEQRMQAVPASDGDSVKKINEFTKKMTSTTRGNHTLPTIDFIRRFAETEVGKRIAQYSENKIDILINDVTNRYEEYCRQASQVFRGYSQAGTVVVSIILALFLNINVMTIFHAFQSNEQLTRAIASQAEQAKTAYRNQAELLKVASAKYASPAAAADTDIEKLKDSIQELRQALKDANQLDLPIGWSDDKFFNKDDLKPNLAVWIITTILTGFLIGLGGPFWFDVVKKVTAIRQAAGTLNHQSSIQDASGNVTPPQKADTSISPENPAAAFKAVVRAQNIINGTEADPIKQS